MRNYLLENAQVETVLIRAKPLFFPVLFELPDHIKETVPASVTLGYQGSFVMRFYCNPLPGDVINYRGFRWQVSHLEHSPQRKGSPKQDECPIVHVEFLGAATP
ncbi:MAG: hypothetical protein HC805_07380 [Alkalinema sp. RL_2_19]|nr:hypothetical protein [Alkalinema sp. RL_2_19]